jgi:hypothetical protein
MPGPNNTKISQIEEANRAKKATEAKKAEKTTEGKNARDARPTKEARESQGSQEVKGSQGGWEVVGNLSSGTGRMSPDQNAARKSATLQDHHNLLTPSPFLL